MSIASPLNFPEESASAPEPCSGDRGSVAPVSPVLPRAGGELIEFHHPRSSGLRVVCMGGGTGLSTLLRGLKRYVRLKGEVPPRGRYISSLSAAVAVSDDGGSSGKLRRDFKMLSPGDLRNCLVALSENEELLAQLFQFRFPAESALDGHSLGNLLLAALNQITGDFGRAIELCSQLLRTRGTPYPCTGEDVQLEAVMDDGSRLRGETVIHNSKKRIVEVMLAPPHVAASPELLRAIDEADLIAIGPGSLFTSLLPNLLVRGVAEAIAASRAVKVYICNLMTEANESLGLTAAGHVRTLYRHVGTPVFSYALINSHPASSELLARYRLEGAEQIVADLDEIASLGVTPITGDFLDEDAGVARHASERIADALLGLTSAAHAIHAGIAVRVA